MTCNHSKKLIYFLGCGLAYLSGYRTHSMISSDSQYRIERRDSKPCLVDRGTGDSWVIDSKFIENLESKVAEAKEDK